MAKSHRPLDQNEVAFACQDGSYVYYKYPEIPRGLKPIAVFFGPIDADADVCLWQSKCKLLVNPKTITAESINYQIEHIPTKANDIQHGGSHYMSLTIQPWDYIARNNIPYLEGSAIKYISRWRDKGGIEDLKKAIHFIEKVIELEQENHESKTS